MPGTKITAHQHSSEDVVIVLWYCNFKHVILAWLILSPSFHVCPSNQTSTCVREKTLPERRLASWVNEVLCFFLVVLIPTTSPSRRHGFCLRSRFLRPSTPIQDLVSLLASLCNCDWEEHWYQGRLFLDQFTCTRSHVCFLVNWQPSMDFLAHCLWLLVLAFLHALWAGTSCNWRLCLHA